MPSICWKLLRRASIESPTDSDFDADTRYLLPFLPDLERRLPQLVSGILLKTQWQQSGALRSIILPGRAGEGPDASPVQGRRPDLQLPGAGLPGVLLHGAAGTPALLREGQQGKPPYMFHR